MKNLAAYTEPGNPNYPPYFSANVCDDHVEITVRNHLLNGMCGDTATIKVSHGAYAEILRQLNESAKEPS